MRRFNLSSLFLISFHEWIIYLPHLPFLSKINRGTRILPLIVFDVPMYINQPVHYLRSYNQDLEYNSTIMNQWLLFWGVWLPRKGRRGEGGGGSGHPPPLSGKACWGGFGILSHFTQKNFRTFIYWDSEELPKTFFSVFHRFDHSEIHLKIKHQFAQEKAVFHRFLFSSFRLRYLLPTTNLYDNYIHKRKI